MWKKLAWLVMIWTASVAVMGGVALVVRWLMSVAGLTLH